MDINDILNTETTADSINSLINDINNSPVVDVPMIDGGLLQGIIDGGSLLDEDSKEEKEIVEDEEKEQDIEEDTDGTVDGEKPAKKKQNKTTEVKETDSEEVQKLKASFAEELEKKETELKKKDEEIKKLKFDGEKKQKQVEDKQEYIDKLKADITLYTEVDDSFDRDDQEAEALDVGYKQLQMTVPLENLRMPAQIVEGVKFRGRRRK
jgi:predicted RNase H-like nuclease (RuvC/YqgF family)